MLSVVWGKKKKISLVFGLTVRETVPWNFPSVLALLGETAL